MSNFAGGMLRKGPDNIWTLAVPIPGTSPMPLIDSDEDAGKYVKGILLNREKVLGKRIYASTDYYTVDEIVQQFKEQFPEDGKGAKAVELPHDVFIGIMTQMGRGSAAQEMLENMRLFNEFGYYGGADLKESHSVSQYRPTVPKDTNLIFLDLGRQIDHLEGILGQIRSFRRTEVDSRLVRCRGRSWA